MIDLPTPELSEEWAQLDPRVRLVVEAVEELAAGYGLPVVVNDIGRASGIHGDWRAIDLRVYHYPRALVREILDLHHRFPHPVKGFACVVLEYNEPGQLAELGLLPLSTIPGALLFNPKATGPHLHIQVPEAATPGWETLPDEVYWHTWREDLGRLPLHEALLSAAPIKTPPLAAGRTDMEKDTIMDGLTDQELGELVPGPRGYQREAGFEIVGEPIVMPVVAVLCKSSKHPVAQLRYLSPHELERGVLEVADRMYCLRVHGRLVIGRMDDVAEIAVDEARGIAFGFSLSGAARLVQWVAGLVVKLKGAVAKL